jgi:hypothetical protein
VADPDISTVPATELEDRWWDGFGRLQGFDD